MPGLTIETDARRSGAAAVPAPASAPAHGGSGSASNPHPPSADGSRAASSRTSSPTRPPISPITPTLGPARLASAASSAAAPAPAPAPPQGATSSTTTPSPRTSLPPKKPNNVTTATTSAAIPDFALGRPAYTLTSQLDQSQTAIPPPPPRPIDFDENPDVLAVRSAITILQLQRARATADIQALQRAKNAALQDPEIFVADLAEGRVGTEGDPLMFPHAVGSDDDDDDESNDDEADDEEEEDSNDEDEGEDQKGDGDIDMLNNEGGAQQQGTSSIPNNTQNKKRKNPAWRKLPKPQNVVRCPPINWSQYAVVGESLNKLHAEQVAAPTPGAPLVLGPGGTYEFNSNNLGQQESERPQKLVGIAAPYVPGRDKIDNNKKSKGGRR